MGVSVREVGVCFLVRRNCHSGGGGVSELGSRAQRSVLAFLKDHAETKQDFWNVCSQKFPFN